MILESIGQCDWEDIWVKKNGGGWDEVQHGANKLDKQATDEKDINKFAFKIVQWNLQLETCYVHDRNG